MSDKPVKSRLRAVWQRLRGAYIAAGYPLLPATRLLRRPLRWLYHRSPLLRHDTQRYWKPWILERAHELLIREHPEEFCIHRGQIKFRSSGSLMSAQGYYVGEIEYHLVQYVLSLLRPGFTMCDVGAHHGVYTVTVAHELRARGWQGTIHSFEPDPRNFAFLRYNLTQNGLAGHAILHPEAVADAPSKRKLVTIPNESSGNYLEGVAPDFGITGTTLREVAVTSLDALASQLPRVDLIKIDVQGAEPLVLAGAREIVKRFRPVIIVEAMQNMPGIDEVRSFLVQHRYCLYGVDAAGQLCLPNSQQAFVSWDWVGVPEQQT